MNIAPIAYSVPLVLLPCPPNLPYMDAYSRDPSWVQARVFPTESMCPKLSIYKMNYPRAAQNIYIQFCHVVLLHISIYDKQTDNLRSHLEIVDVYYSSDGELQHGIWNKNGCMVT